jgi:hypothetical protein
MTFSRNFIDLLTPAMSFGVDTANGMFGETVSKLTIDHNHLATYGEIIENEFSRNPDGVQNVEHNTIIMVSIRVSRVSCSGSATRARYLFRRSGRAA